mgnify:CR=1 FL=1
MKRSVLFLQCMAVVMPAAAMDFSLTHRNSILEGNDVDLLTNWWIDGVDVLVGNNYYFRIGQGAEAKISTIGNPVIQRSAPNVLRISFTDSIVQVELTYTLIGQEAGSGMAAFSEIVIVRNRMPSPLEFHLFDYVDVDLSGTPADDYALWWNPSSIMQTEYFPQGFLSSAPPFDRWEIDSPSSLLTKMTDGQADNLSNGTSPYGPGNVAFGMQWNRTISPNGTFILSKSKQVMPVPEPGTIIGWGFGLAVFAFGRRASRRTNRGPRSPGRLALCDENRRILVRKAADFR